MIVNRAVNTYSQMFLHWIPFDSVGWKIWPNGGTSIRYWGSWKWLGLLQKKLLLILRHFIFQKTDNPRTVSLIGNILIYVWEMEKKVEHCSIILYFLVWSPKSKYKWILLKLLHVKSTLLNHPCDWLTMMEWVVSVCGVFISFHGISKYLCWICCSVVQKALHLYQVQPKTKLMPLEKLRIFKYYDF